MHLLLNARIQTYISTSPWLFEPQKLQVLAEKSRLPDNVPFHHELRSLLWAALLCQRYLGTYHIGAGEGGAGAVVASFTLTLTRTLHTFIQTPLMSTARRDPQSSITTNSISRLCLGAHSDVSRVEQPEGRCTVLLSHNVPVKRSHPRSCTPPPCSDGWT